MIKSVFIVLQWRHGIYNLVKWPFCGQLYQGEQTHKVFLHRNLYARTFQVVGYMHHDKGYPNGSIHLACLRKKMLIFRSNCVSNRKCRHWTNVTLNENMLQILWNFYVTSNKWKFHPAGVCGTQLYGGSGPSTGPPSLLASNSSDGSSSSTS